MEPHKPELPINQGGLYRCCIQSLWEALITEEEGDIYVCPHCHTQMIVFNGVWQWGFRDK